MPFDFDVRLAEWRKALLDTTKRNRLIKFVSGRVGGVALVRPASGALWTALVKDGKELTFVWKRDLLGLPEEALNAETLAADFDPQRGTADIDPEAVRRELLELCLRSERLTPHHVLTDFTDRQLAARLLRLKRLSDEAQADHGVTTLFAAFGFLKWFESADSEEEIRSPLLLVPVSLRRETVESPFTLAAEEDDVLLNHCLAELLRAQFRISMPAEGFDPDDPEWAARYFATVRERVQHVPRWEVVEEAALGVFNFQKLAMWEDLGRNAERVQAHPLCRAIAGDNSVSLAPPGDLPTAEQLDAVVPPVETQHILDADSSQHEAAEAVKRGAHLVMDGPPGTGKSQTIANMIAEALAAGKSVLFVSEKTAALEVVKRRLDKCGLGDFCLELHSHRSNKREIVAELGRCLELKREGAPDIGSQLSALAEARFRLNTFVAELHAVRQPLGLSAYRVQGEVAKLDALPGRSRVAIPDVFDKDGEYLRTSCESLARLADCKPVLDNPTGHPWRGSKLATFSQEAKDDARFHLKRLADATPAAEKAIAALADAGVIADPPSVPEWDAAVADARSLAALPFFPAEWFADDPRAAAGRAVELHRAATEVRELSARLPEFDLAAVKQLGASTDVLGAVRADRERLTAGASLSLRQRHDAVTRMASAVRELNPFLEVLDREGRAAALALGLPQGPELGRLAECARLLSVFARTGPGPRGWWDAGRRKELLAAATRGDEQDRAAQATRTELLAKLSPVAFAPESSAVARDAAHAGRSFWSRLFPRWWGLSKQAAAWYSGPAPTGAAFRADLARLAAYHQQTETVRQVATAYRAELEADAAGNPDWPATLEALRAVDVLSAWGVKTDALAHQDRKALSDTAASLMKAESAFRARLHAVAREFVVPNLDSRTPGDAREWLAGEAAALDREFEGLRVLAGALAAGKDVPGPRVREAAELVARLARAAERVRQLEPGQPADEQARAERATLGEELLRFLDRWNRPVPPALASALTDRAARERVAVAVKECEAARGGTFASSLEYVTHAVFPPDVEVSSGVVLNRHPLSELGRWCAERAADADRVFEWVRFVHTERDIVAAGLGGVLDEVRAKEFAPEQAADAFRARFYRLWLDALHEKVPALGAFTTDGHERLITRFAALDRSAIQISAASVRAGLLQNTARPRRREDAPDASELGLLLREVNKKRRHIPLRHLFARLPTLLPRIKPCLMMSPLAVSTYLDNSEFSFDLVIFDEASQVRPHDAVCAIYRAQQLVVGGDPKQLPPTDFFTRTGDEDDPQTDEGGTAPFESLLDVCLSLGICRKRLRWHYRSRREGLIAFSNVHFYAGSLVTFPSADEATERAVKFVHVPDGRFKDGVNAVEARHVAGLVMEHARTSPDLSIGVIAFSQRQQDRILDELEVLRRQSKEHEAFFSADREDPFFVKNLENVQGDERDVMLLSVGYGPDETGKVMMRFGPLNRQGGERRLNVAVTRARRAMTVVASMTADDIDLSRTGAEGSKLLKAFLDYAARGPVALPVAVTEAHRRAGDSPFEQEVGDELARRGLKVHRQVGCGGYLIDLAVTDGQSGRYLLGIECDGATYHSAATARDRDRLRRAVLEGLGWRLVRVWSTDWVRDRNAQVNRVLAALEQVRRGESLPPKVQQLEGLAPLTRLPVPNQPRKSKSHYDSIERVPDSEVEESLFASLTEYGSMPAEDLISAVSKRLGFKRVGPNIRDRVAAALNALVAAGRLAVTEENRVKSVQPT